MSGDKSKEYVMTNQRDHDDTSTGAVQVPGPITGPINTMPTAEEQEKLTGRVVPVMTVLVVTAFMMILNETTLGIAIPHLMADFEVTQTTAQWLSTGFMLTMAIVIPATGFIIQRYTTRAIFMFAVGSFILGTLLAALAPTFAVIVVARVLQAIGTAIIMPLLMTTMLTSVPVQHRGTVMGFISVVISVAPAIGPSVSGLIIQALDWRWIFFIMLPLAVIALVLGLILIRTDEDIIDARISIPSLLISAVAFGGIVYGLSTISEVFAGNWLPVVVLAAGAIALVIFVIYQNRLTRTGTPLLDFRPFRSRNYTVAVIVVMIAMASIFGTIIVMPLYLQLGRGLSVLDAGLLLLPGGLVMGLAAPFIGRIYDKVGPRPLVIPGTVVVSAGIFLISMLGDNTPLWELTAFHVLMSVGMSMLMTPLMTASLGSLPRPLYSHGSAIMNTLQQLAGAAGTAVFIAVLAIGAGAAEARGLDAAAAQVEGAQHAFLVGGFVSLVAVALSPLVKKPVDDPDAQFALEAAAR